MDIMERLRSPLANLVLPTTCNDAANEIERLHEANAKMAEILNNARIREHQLRAALNHIYDKLCWDEDRERWFLHPTFQISLMEVAVRSAIKRALDA